MYNDPTRSSITLTGAPAQALATKILSSPEEKSGILPWSLLSGKVVIRIESGGTSKELEWASYGENLLSSRGFYRLVPDGILSRH